MDPVAVAELWKLGPVVSLLIAAVWYFHRRDVRNDQRAEAQRHECEKRSADLGTRIENLEDHLLGKYADLAERTAAGLAASTAALRRSLGDQVTPPGPLPTLHIHHPSDAR